MRNGYREPVLGVAWCKVVKRLIPIAGLDVGYEGYAAANIGAGFDGVIGSAR